MASVTSILQMIGEIFKIVKHSSHSSDLMSVKELGDDEAIAGKKVKEDRNEMWRKNLELDVTLLLFSRSLN